MHSITSSGGLVDVASGTMQHCAVQAKYLVSASRFRQFSHS